MIIFICIGIMMLGLLSVAVCLCRNKFECPRCSSSRVFLIWEKDVDGNTIERKYQCNNCSDTFIITRYKN
jgi:DNA-directed RNA polymerase subunit RPC12/RpoP